MKRHRYWLHLPVLADHSNPAFTARKASRCRQRKCMLLSQRRRNGTSYWRKSLKILISYHRNRRYVTGIVTLSECSLTVKVDTAVICTPSTWLSFLKKGDICTPVSPTPTSHRKAQNSNQGRVYESSCAPWMHLYARPSGSRPAGEKVSTWVRCVIRNIVPSMGSNKQSQV